MLASRFNKRDEYKGSTDLARIDQGIKPVNDNLRTTKPQHGHSSYTAKLRRCLGERREEESGPNHRGFQARPARSNSAFLFAEVVPVEEEEMVPEGSRC